MNEPRQQPATGSRVDAEWLVNQIAHALRNPLFAAGLQIETLALLAQGRPELDAHLRGVTAQLHRLQEAIDDMLLFGRPVQINPRPVRLAAVADSVAVACRAGLRRRAVAVEIRSEDVELMTDADAVRTLLERLLDNAVDHNPELRQVDLTIRRDREWAAVEVHNDGEPTPPDILARATLPFFPQHRGRLGLGLAIATKLATALGGSLELRSPPSGGFDAELRLPMRPVRPA